MGQNSHLFICLISSLYNCCVWQTKLRRGYHKCIFGQWLIINRSVVSEISQRYNKTQIMTKNLTLRRVYHRKHLDHSFSHWPLWNLYLKGNHYLCMCSVRNNDTAINLHKFKDKSKDAKCNVPIDSFSNSIICC
jgi:hypothetical protein